MPALMGHLISTWLLAECQLAYDYDTREQTPWASRDWMKSLDFCFRAHESLLPSLGRLGFKVAEACNVFVYDS